MNPGLTDCLTLRGTASFNVQVRHRLARREGVDFGYPYHLEDTPKHDNHAKLFYLNELARNRGCKEPFKCLTVLKPSTGEVFLSAYFNDQLSRNTTTGVDGIGRCLCGPACLILLPLPPPNLDKVVITQIPHYLCYSRACNHPNSTHIITTGAAAELPATKSPLSPPTRTSGMPV